MEKRRVVVIGAGMGGLSATIDLAARGYQVTLLESAKAPGGKMRETRIGDHSIDSGPTVLTMRWVFDELFRFGAAELAERVVLQPTETLARHAWSASERLDLFADTQANEDAIGDFAGAGAVRGYRRFRERAREIYSTLEDSFLRSELPTPIGLVRRSGGLSSLLKINPFETMWKELGRFFKDSRLRQLFGRYATYCGSSPFEAPATLLIVAHVELEGVWTVSGGMQRLAEAMAQLARENGADVRLESPVEQIAVRNGRANGVILESGEQLECDAVVVNGDPNAIATGALGHAARPACKRAPTDRRSLSALTWAMVAPTAGFPLERHNVFFGSDYAGEFEEIFRHQRLPSDPTVYVCCQDRGCAPTPTSEERLFLIVNAPAVGDLRSLETTELDACAQATFRRLERCGLTVAHDPTRTVVTDPKDFARRFPSSGGAIYGLANHGSRATFKRPGARSRISGIYLAGGSTHPGPGVPNSILSGRLAAAALNEDLRSSRGAREAIPQSAVAILRGPGAHAHRGE